MTRVLGFAVVLLASCSGRPDVRDGVPFQGTEAVEDDSDAAGDTEAPDPGDTSSGVAESSGDPSDPSAATDDPTTPTTTEDPTTGGGSDLDPPAGGSSGGSGGGAASGSVRMTTTGVQYRVIAPGSAGPLPAMIVYSGTEGGAQMTSNLMGAGVAIVGSNVVFGVLDGVQYNGNGQAGADVLDTLREDYDIDNDMTWLLSESAGTTAGLELGLQLRQSYFAAYWANDVNAQASPLLTAAELGFEPYGNAGPGGDYVDADAIVQGMMTAGYRTPAPAPYDGPGAGTHGDPQQFYAALEWFPGKTRQ